MTRASWIAGTMLLLAPMAAIAQDAQAPCPATPAALPAELAAWTRPAPLTAGASEKSAATLTIGTAVDMTLLPGAKVSYAASPAKPGASGTSGGVATFTVTRAGRYRVALGASAWIDVVRNSAALKSTGHGHGPACSSIRKIVDFKLTPGRYVLQIAGSPQPTVAVLVAAAR